MAKPEGVRIVHEDGSKVECELVHIGEEDGLDIWGIAGATLRPNHDHVEVDVFPPRTGLRFVGEMPPGYEIYL